MSVKSLRLHLLGIKHIEVLQLQMLRQLHISIAIVLVLPEVGVQPQVQLVKSACPEDLLDLLVHVEYLSHEAELQLLMNYLMEILLHEGLHFVRLLVRAA